MATSRALRRGLLSHGWEGARRRRHCRRPVAELLRRCCGLPAGLIAIDAGLLRGDLLEDDGPVVAVGDRSELVYAITEALSDRVGFAEFRARRANRTGEAFQGHGHGELLRVGSCLRALRDFRPVHIEIAHDAKGFCATLQI